MRKRILRRVSWTVVIAVAAIAVIMTAYRVYYLG